GFYELLRIVPRCPSVGHQVREEHPRDHTTDEEPPQGQGPKYEPNSQGGGDGEQAWLRELLDRGRGNYPTALRVIGFGRPLHNSRNLPELAPDLVHDRVRRPPHCLDQETREVEGEEPSD